MYFRHLDLLKKKLLYISKWVTVDINLCKLLSALTNNYIGLFVDSGLNPRT